MCSLEPIRGTSAAYQIAQSTIARVPHDFAGVALSHFGALCVGGELPIFCRIMDATAHRRLVGCCWHFVMTRTRV